MIFTHSGHLGDILYSLPTIKILSGNEPATLYIKTVFEDRNSAVYGNTDYTQFEAIQALLLQQPYIKEVKPFVPADGLYSPGNWTGLNEKFIDLDDSRKQSVSIRRYRFHIERYFLQFGINEDWRDHVPWLTVNGEWKVKLNYAIFHVTDRWHGYNVDWSRHMEEARKKYDVILFTGYKTDHEKFERRYGKITYHPTKDLLHLAQEIRDCQALYCNQNCALVIAQGLGKNYFLARNADRTHCHTFLKNETIIS